LNYLSTFGPHIIFLYDEYYNCNIKYKFCYILIFRKYIIKNNDERQLKNITSCIIEISNY